MKLILLFLLWISPFSAQAQGETQDILKPLSVKSPHQTMNLFMTAMSDYREGKKTKNKKLVSEIEKATQTIDLSHVAFVVRKDRGKQIAILLKEVIDRVYIFRPSQVPSLSSNEEPLKSWTIPNTEITLNLISEGPRSGDYLFSQETVERVHDFYKKVKHLPYLRKSGGGAFYEEPFLQKYLPRWVQGTTFGLAHWKWAGLLLCFILGLFLKIFTEQMIEIFKSISNKVTALWSQQLIERLEKPAGMLACTGFWYLSLLVLRIEGVTLTILLKTLQIILSLSLIWFIFRLVGFFAQYISLISQKTSFKFDDQLIPLVDKGLKVLVIVVGFLLMIQNLGINVMSVLAGLGLGGLAFALAAKDTAANFFGSVMILWDQPFKIGDWIVTQESEGFVENIGFRSTRIRTLYDSQISIPNAVLANETIDNLGRRTYHRTKTTLGITYDTPTEKIEAFMKGISEIILANPKSRKDKVLVVFDSFGDHSLNLLVYFFLRVNSWSEEVVEKQYIYLEIMRLAEKLEVEFAFPTKKIYLEKTNPSEKTSFDLTQLSSISEQFGKDGSLSLPYGTGVYTGKFNSSKKDKK